jgi:hypothetical protein
MQPTHNFCQSFEAKPKVLPFRARHHVVVVVVVVVVVSNVGPHGASGILSVQFGIGGIGHSRPAKRVDANIDRRLVEPGARFRSTWQKIIAGGVECASYLHLSRL